MTQRDVPHLYLADFSIASQVQTLSTRITAQRGTPGYEAPVSTSGPTWKHRLMLAHRRFAGKDR